MTCKDFTARLALAGLGLTMLPALAAAGQAPVAAVSSQPPAVQSTPAAASSAQGPILVQQVHNGFVIAPEFQIGKVAGRTADFAGAYGGWLFDNHLLIGGAGYGLANGSRTRGMAYGGALVEWLADYNDWVSFGLRGLLGGGQATLPATITVTGYGYPFDHDWRTGMPTPVPQTLQIAVRRDFFIFQPQADLRLKLANRIHLNWGVGYRAVAGAGSFNSQLRGVSGSVGLEVGLGGS